MRYRAYFLTGILLVFFCAENIFAEDDGIGIFGDFRCRYELSKIQDQESRPRHRIRLRLNLEAPINNDFYFHLQLVTGPDNPVTVNQTLGDGFSTKEIRIQEAYVGWRVPYIENLLMYVGKVNVPFYSPDRSELVWDNDLRPEGFSALFAHIGESYALSLNGGIFIVEERSSDDDAYLAGIQAGLKTVLDQRKSYIFAAAGYFDYINAKDHPTFFTSDDGIGNSLDANGNYLYGFKLVDLIAEMGGVFFKKMPISIFGEYVINTSPDEDNTGWTLGLKLGMVKEAGNWDFRYLYRLTEKDAVVGRFTDSAFLGGGTNGKGHEIILNYIILKNTMLSGTFFFNKKNLDNERNFYRHHIELTFGF
jgi:hypothetical protein